MSTPLGYRICCPTDFSCEHMANCPVRAEHLRIEHARAAVHAEPTPPVIRPMQTLGFDSSSIFHPESIFHPGNANLIVPAIPPSQVSHPSHYTSVVPGIECIQVVQHFNFNRGNAIKYIWRAGSKSNEIEDLQKAMQYLEFEIARLTKAKAKT